MEETLKKHSVKIQVGTLIAIIIFIATFSSNYTQRMADIESNLRHLNGKTELYTERYATTIADQQALKIDMAKIQTKLTSIEALILEVKTDLKKK